MADRPAGSDTALTPTFSRVREREDAAADSTTLSRVRERGGPAQREGEGQPPPCYPVARRLLILGGTSEAAELARRVVAESGDGLDVITSLAGRLPWQPDLPGRVRVGGFGGAAGLAAYLAAERIDALVDATHPFAAVISRNAADACAACAVPRLMLIRPAWRPGPGDRWLEVDSLDQAAGNVAAMARRVFLTTGPGGIEAFTESRCWFLVRLFAAHSAPLPLVDYETVVERPPFTREDERALMLRHRIDTLVTKNSGGPTATKLQAARDLGIRVVMIRRPPISRHPGHTVDNVRDALAWVGGHL